MVCEDGNDDSDDAGHRDADTKPEGNHEDTEVQDHWVFEAEGLSEIYFSYCFLISFLFSFSVILFSSVFWLNIPYFGDENNVS